MTQPDVPTPRRLPPSHRRAFIRRHTRLQEPAAVPFIRLHLADSVEPVWNGIEDALGIDSAPIPYWAFAWAGGMGLARWIRAHAATVAGRSVLDMATGSGIVAIAAAQAGAERVVAVDIDPFAETAVALNARANSVRVAASTRDLLGEPPPAMEVILAADTWYEPRLAERVLPWLRAAAARGSLVIVADPGRPYLPSALDAGFHPLARYRVPTATTLEEREVAMVDIFRVVADDATRGG